LDTTVLLDITTWLDVRADPLLSGELPLVVFLVPFSASKIKLCILDFKLLLKLLVIESVEFSSMAYTFKYELKTDNVANMKMVTYKLASMFIVLNVIVLYYFLANISKSIQKFEI
jgi:hypothetical protein